MGRRGPVLIFRRDIRIFFGSNYDLLLDKSWINVTLSF